MSNDRKHQAPASPPGPAYAARPGMTGPGGPAEEDEYAAVAAGEPEAPVGPAAPVGQTDNGGAGEDSESELADDEVAAAIEALTAKAEKADEYLELAKRTKADFENYRKRAIREAAAAQDRGVAKLALELLPAVDNLDRALEAADA